MSREAHVRICERLGYVRPRSTRLLLMIPPKFSVAHTVGFLKGEVGDADISRISASEAAFHRASFLGSGLLRQYGRIRGAGDPGVHPKPGTGREAPRADAIGRALTIAPSGGHHTTLSAGGS